MVALRHEVDVVIEGRAVEGDIEPVTKKDDEKKSVLKVWADRVL